MDSRKKNAKTCQEQALSLTSVEVSDEELEKVVGGRGDERYHGLHGYHDWRGSHGCHGHHDDHDYGYHPGGHH
jgi:hypothetical protein